VGTEEAAGTEAAAGMEEVGMGVGTEAGGMEGVGGGVVIILIGAILIGAGAAVTGEAVTGGAVTRGAGAAVTTGASRIGRFQKNLVAARSVFLAQGIIPLQTVP
jgi:hypothetical protein